MLLFKAPGSRQERGPLHRIEDGRRFVPFANRPVPDSLLPADVMRTIREWRGSGSGAAAGTFPLSSVPCGESIVYFAGESGVRPVIG